MVRTTACVPAPTASGACDACAGGGMGMSGGAAAALHFCAQCAAADAAAPAPAADGSRTLALPQAATAAPAGAAFKLATFVLETLQRGPCARLASPVCATLLEGQVRRVTTARVSAPAGAPLALGARANASTPPLALALTADVARAPAAPSAAFDVFAPKDPFAAADPDVLSLSVMLQPPSGVDGDNGTLVLTTATVSLANGAPMAAALPSPVSAPLALGAAAYAAFGTPPYDASAAAHAHTPAAGTYPHRPISALAFAPHELTYLGYDALLDASPHTGALLIWQLDAAGAVPSGAAPLLTPPRRSSPAAGGRPSVRFGGAPRRRRRRRPHPPARTRPRRLSARRGRGAGSPPARTARRCTG